MFPQKGKAPQFPVAICLYMTVVFHIINKLTPLNFSYNVTQKTLRGKKNICSIFLKIWLSVISIKEQKDRICSRLVIQSFYNSRNVRN